MDIKLTPDKFGEGDITIGHGDIVVDDGLYTAIYISIFTEYGSYWADPELGSRLHTIFREKSRDEVLPAFNAEISRCLAWLVDSGVAESVSVDTSRVETVNLAIAVSVKKPTGVSYAYSYTWEAVEHAA